MTSRGYRAVGLVLLLSAPFILAAVPGEARTLNVEDVIRLHFSGVSEEVIISEIIVTESVFVLSVDELVRLKEAGFSDRLLKFMIDTSLTDGYDLTVGEDAEDLLGPGEEEEYVQEYGDEEGYGQIWENVIVEEPVTTEYFATLDWNYPGWYYDCYWYDYWYWDCGYSPYRSSWCLSFGAWYPGWYSIDFAYAPGCWGYRGCQPYWGYCGSNSWAYSAGYRDGWAGGYEAGSGDAWYAGGGGPPPGLSDVKYKRGGGGSGKLLYADAGLKVRDVTTRTKRPATLDLDKPRTKKVLVADTRHGRLDKPGERDPRPVRVGAGGASDLSASRHLRTPVRTSNRTTPSVTRRPATRRPTVPDRPTVTRKPTDRRRPTTLDQRKVVTRTPSRQKPKTVRATPPSPRAKPSVQSKPRTRTVTPRATKPATRSAPRVTPSRSTSPRGKTASRAAPRTKTPSR